MGKARILNHQGASLYNIEILEDRTRAENELSLVEDRIIEIDEKIIEIETDLDSAQDEVDSAASAQDQAIAIYVSEQTESNREQVTKAGEELIEAAAKRDSINGEIRTLKVERLALQRKIDLINALPPLRQQQAWCADYNEELTGEVATAEVPGEVGQVLIQPSYEGGAVWSGSEDGQIQPALAGTPASVFYNLAMLPGWQKWRPTFRIATVSNISNDLCDITLDAATSSQQGLDVNSRASYTGVPIAYMECNGGAFEEGDRALVAFSGNTDQPMVVGFETDPKICGFILAFPIGFQIPETRRYSIQPDPCTPDASITGASDGAASSAILRVGRRARVFSASTDVDSAQTIEALGVDYTNRSIGTYPFTQFLPSFDFHDPPYQREPDLSPGVCVDDVGILGVTKVASMNQDGTALLGGSVTVSLTQGTLDVYGQMSEGDAFLRNCVIDGINKMRYLAWPGTDEKYNLSASLTITDFADLELGGNNYAAEEIIKVVDSDNPYIPDTWDNDLGYYWYPHWVLVKYKRSFAA